MKKQRYKPKFYIYLCLAIACALLSGRALAEASGEWLIISPVPDSRVKGPEVLLALRLVGGQEISREKTFVLVDGKNMSAAVKISGNRLSLLISGPLRPGEHKIEVLSRDAAGEKLPPLRWRFTVEGDGSVESSGGEVSAGAHSSPQVSSRLVLNSNAVSLNGPGAGLRQEPDHTNTLQFEGRAAYGKIVFPVKLFLTSDETSRFQPRQRFQVGMETGFLKLYYGDNFPVLESLVWSGNRIRGLHGRLSVIGIHLEFLHGDILRGVEGRLLRLQPGSTVTPVNLRRDSTYVVGGTFTRKATGFRLYSGTEKKVRVGLTALKVKDDTSSIRFGSLPKENVVVGGDLSLAIYRGKSHWKLSGGAALSITTDDISTGPASSAEIDSLFGVTPPFDPADFENIITLNTTTSPIDPVKGGSLAMFARTQLKVAAHLLSAEYKSIGPAYQSFGNPYLRNDRRGLTLSDRFTLFENRLLATVRYQQFKDNLADDQTATRQNRRIFSNFFIAPHPAYPRLNIGFSRLWRDQQAPAGGDWQRLDVIQGMSAGVSYALTAFEIRHTLNVNYNHTKRTDERFQQNRNTVNTLNVNLMEQLSDPLMISLQMMWQQLTYALTGTSQNQSLLGAAVSYRLPTPRLNLGLSVRNLHMGAGLFVPESDRLFVELTSQFTLLRDMTIELGAGYSSYSEAQNDRNTYDETYVFLRHSYGFSLR